MCRGCVRRPGGGPVRRFPGAGAYPFGHGEQLSERSSSSGRRVVPIDTCMQQARTNTVPSSTSSWKAVTGACFCSSSSRPMESTNRSRRTAYGPPTTARSSGSIANPHLSVRVRRSSRRLRCAIYRRAAVPRRGCIYDRRAPIFRRPSTIPPSVTVGCASNTPSTPSCPTASNS